MRQHRKGFTLVELLVVMGIIAVLMAILLPSLSRARASADRIKCANNLRSIGQGLAIYINENRGYLPAAYNYRDSAVTVAADGTVSQTGLNGVGTPNKAYGYVHWSSYLNGTVPAEAFQCATQKNGGLPASFPRPEDAIGGQTVSGNAAVPAVGTPLESALAGLSVTVFGGSTGYYADAQAPRVAYSLNEALFCRPKYGTNWDGIVRTSRNVNIAEVKNASGTIAATEFAAEWQIVSGISTTGGVTVVKSHRPIQPFRTVGGTGDVDKDPTSVADLNSSMVGITLPTESLPLRRTTVADLWHMTGGYSYDLEVDAAVSGNYGETTRNTRLDWVGRPHPGTGDKARENATNFLYLDGHVETKSILQTIPAKAGDTTPWEWGDKCYSIPLTVVQ